MSRSATFIFVLFLSYGASAQAARFNRQELIRVQEQLSLERRPDVEKLRAKYRALIVELMTSYESAINRNSTDEDRLRAVATTLSANRYSLPDFDKAQSKTLTIRQERELFFRELAALIAEKIRASQSPLTPDAPPAYRDPALGRLAYSPVSVRQNLGFAAALIAQVSNKQMIDLPAFYGFVLPGIATLTVGTGIAFMILSAVPWTVALFTDLLALGSSWAAFKGIPEWYRNREAKQAIAAFTPALLAQLGADGEGARSKALDALFRGDLDALQTQLCGVYLEPPALPQVRIAEFTDADDDAIEVELVELDENDLPPSSAATTARRP